MWLWTVYLLLYNWLDDKPQSASVQQTCFLTQQLCAKAFERTSPRTFFWESSAEVGWVRPDWHILTLFAQGLATDDWLPLISPGESEPLWAMWAWVSYRSLSLTMKDLASALASPLAMNGCILVQTMLWVGLCFPDWWLWLVEQPPGDRYWLDLTVLLTGSIRCQRGQLQRAGGIVQVCRNPVCVTGRPLKQLQFHSPNNFMLQMNSWARHLILNHWWGFVVRWLLELGSAAPSQWGTCATKKPM